MLLPCCESKLVLLNTFVPNRTADLLHRSRSLRLAVILHWDNELWLKSGYTSFLLLGLQWCLQKKDKRLAIVIWHVYFLGEWNERSSLKGLSAYFKQTQGGAGQPYQRHNKRWCVQPNSIPGRNENVAWCHLTPRVLFKWICHRDTAFLLGTPIARVLLRVAQYSVKWAPCLMPHSQYTKVLSPLSLQNGESAFATPCAESMLWSMLTSLLPFNWRHPCVFCV